MRKLLHKGTTESRTNPEPLKTDKHTDPASRDDVLNAARSALKPSEHPTDGRAGPADFTVGPVGESRAVAEPYSKEGAASFVSIVGRSMVIEGDLEAAEDIVIAGRVEGSIKQTANRLTIDPTGVVKAAIKTQSLIVAGRVEGDIECLDVVLKDTARVTGNIRTASLSIVDGALFNGSVTMVKTEAP